MQVWAFFIILIFLSPLRAAVISPSAEEFKFSYQAEFYTAQPQGADELASQHAQHLFGYFQSPTLVKKFSLNPEIFGIGAPKLPLKVEILHVENQEGQRLITYRASGLILINKKIGKLLREKNKFEITLPFDIDNFYTKKCTDPKYYLFEDFWYFYDPFKDGCSHLREEPLAAPVVLTFAPLSALPSNFNAGFEDIRGDNGNGELIQITTINGYSDDAKTRRDEGRKAFKNMNAWLVENGFEETILANYKNRPIFQFEKKIRTPNGEIKLVRITRLLAETSSESKNVTFAKFFKKAIFEADVIIYAGHSGLGSYLDINFLETKAGPFVFNPKKRQIFFFDGCSSYSYYLSMFEKMKPKSRVDILTNGLQSLFGYENPTHQAFIRELLNFKTNPSWLFVLKKMEQHLDGSTFMLNAGAL